MSENNFYSIDRLIEFGMSMALAQQMIHTMNQAMQSMHIPGAMNTIQPPPQALYYAVLNGKQVGPLSEAELCKLILDRQITLETYIWKPGMSNWQTAEKMPDVLKLVALSPPPFQDQSTPNK